MIARVAGNLHPARLTGPEIGYSDPTRRILLAYLGVGNPGYLGVERVGVVDKRNLGNSSSVKLPVGDRPTIGTPAKTISQPEFFFVDPVKSPVDDLFRGRLREFSDRMIIYLLDIDIALVNVRHAPPARRDLGEHETRRGDVSAELG